MFSWAADFEIETNSGSGYPKPRRRPGIYDPGNTVFEGKRKRSPTTRTRAVLSADMMILEGEAALKPAR
jgi:hypothetical protein